MTLVGKEMEEKTDKSMLDAKMTVGKHMKGVTDMVIGANQAKKLPILDMRRKAPVLHKAGGKRRMGSKE